MPNDKPNRSILTNRAVDASVAVAIRRYEAYSKVHMSPRCRQVSWSRVSYGGAATSRVSRPSTTAMLPRRIGVEPAGATTCDTDTAPERRGRFHQLCLSLATEISVTTRNSIAIRGRERQVIYISKVLRDESRPVHYNATFLGCPLWAGQQLRLSSW